MDAMFNLDLDNASAQEIWSRIDGVQGIAETATYQGDHDDYINWAAQSVAGLDQYSLFYFKVMIIEIFHVYLMLCLTVHELRGWIQ